MYSLFESRNQTPSSCPGKPELAFQKNEALRSSWKRNQLDINFLKTITNEQWPYIESLGINPLESIFNKCIELVAEGKEVDVSCIEYLISTGYKFTNFTWNSTAAILTNFKVKDLAFNKEKHNLLNFAILIGDTLLLRIILGHFGTDFFPIYNDEDQNIAHIAATTNNPEMLSHIALYFGSKYFNQVDHYGKYPLHYVTKERMIIEMLRFRVDINSKDKNGNSLLHYLMEQKASHIAWNILLPVLMTHNADFTLLNNKDQSPLDIVLDHSEFTAFCWIWTTIRTSLTAEFIQRTLDRATKKGYKSIVEFILTNVGPTYYKDLTKKLIEHPNINTLENFSSKLGSESGLVKLDDMKLALTRLYEKFGSDFKCVALSLEDLPVFIKNLNDHLSENKSKDFNIYYLIKGGGHWICGEISINNSEVKNILIIDPLVNWHPTDKVYDSYKENFPLATIYLSGCLKQGNDTYCGIYCLDDIEHMVKVREYLPDTYNKDLYHYLSVNQLPSAFIKLRECDIMCRLPGYLLRTTRSLNGQDNSYCNYKQTYWARHLEEAELIKFKEKKGMSMHDNLEKYIQHSGKKAINLRLEHIKQRMQEKFVAFYLKNTPEHIESLQNKANVYKIK